MEKKKTICPLLHNFLQEYTSKQTSMKKKKQENKITTKNEPKNLQ